MTIRSPLITPFEHAVRALINKEIKSAGLRHFKDQVYQAALNGPAAVKALVRPNMRSVGSLERIARGVEDLISEFQYGPRGEQEG